jgi:Ca2+/Na+ antiporter
MKLFIGFCFQLLLSIPILFLIFVLLWVVIMVISLLSIPGWVLYCLAALYVGGAIINDQEEKTENEEKESCK